jgi:hypothetical protein
MPNAEITLGGGANIFASLKQSWTSVWWEQVVKADPECIIINDYSTPSASPPTGPSLAKPGRSADPRRYLRYPVFLAARRFASSSALPALSTIRPSSARTAGSSASSPATSCQTRPRAMPKTPWPPASRS